MSYIDRNLEREIDNAKSDIESVIDHLKGIIEDLEKEIYIKAL